MKAVLGFAFLLILEIVIFCLVRKRSKHVLTIVFVLLWLITLKFIVFPPVSGIPTHGSYEIAYEDNWVTEDVASILDGRLQTKKAGEQLMMLNRDCIEWMQSLEDK